MARPTKQGLEYFPINIDIFDDDKIALISSEFGAVGEAVLMRLLCKIYKNGYFYSWGGDERLLFCRWAGGIFVPSQVDEVVKGCLRRSVFDNGVFEMFGILTSRGIQKRYLQATIERKEVEVIEGFWLLEIPKIDRFKVVKQEIEVNPPINTINPPINEINRTESTQSKVKESKVKKSKEERKEASLPLPLPDHFKDLFSKTWKMWLTYRKDIGKPYKSAMSEHAQIKALSKHSEEIAVAMIENAIASGWQGIFELKNQQNGRIQDNKRDVAGITSSVDGREDFGEGFRVTRTDITL